MSVVRLGVNSLGPDRLTSKPSLESEQLADGPLALYLMQETSGTTMYDSSGNGRNGTYTNATLAQAALDPNSQYSVSFSGSSTSKAQVAHGSWMDTASWTIECLVHDTARTSHETPVSRYNGTTGWTWLHSSTQSDLFAWNASGTSYGGTPTGTVMSANRTYHIAAHWDASAGKCRTYLNGSLNYELNVTGNAATPATALHIAISNPNNSSLAYPFGGRISHVALYGTALSASRILAHAKAAGLV